MKFSAPKQATWLLALLVAIVGVVAHFVAIPGLSQYDFWVVLIAFVLLFLGTILKGF